MNTETLWDLGAIFSLIWLTVFVWVDQGLPLLAIPLLLGIFYFAYPFIQLVRNRGKDARQ